MRSRFQQRRMQALDFLGDQVLQSPEIAVADAVLLELGDGVEEILGAGTGMAAGARQDMRHPLVILLLDPERTLDAGPEGEGLDPALRGLDMDPARGLEALARGALA